MVTITQEAVAALQTPDLLVQAVSAVVAMAVQQQVIQVPLTQAAVVEAVVTLLAEQVVLA
jgi:hypothetical protein